MKHIPLALCLMLCMASATAQNRTQEDAVARAAAFARAVGLESTFREASRWQNGRNGPWQWKVRTEDGRLEVGIDEVTGKVTAFMDLGLATEIHDKSRNTERWLIETDGHAWLAADRVLQASGLDSDVYARKELTWLAREPGALQDLNNKGTMLVAQYAERVDGLEGDLNTATVTFDVVSGRLLTFGASVIWRFDPPRATMSQGEAAQIIRGLMERRAASVGRLAAAYKWPGDDAARTAMKVAVVCGGSKAFGSEYGEALADRWTARAAWTLELPAISVAIDAENGQPMFEGVKQHASHATREPSAANLSGSQADAESTAPWPATPRQLIGGVVALVFVAGYVLFRRPRPV
jgi:hypothetical protein